ncbi:hypothetical protein D9M68_916530 [compost metagenome]
MDCLRLVVPLSEERAALVHDEVASMALERQQAINADHPVVTSFWELVEFLNGPLNEPGGTLNHSRKSSFVAIHLNEVIEMAANKRQQVPPLSELKHLLKTSKSPKFLETNKAVNSARATDIAGQPKTVRCWLFQLV